MLRKFLKSNTKREKGWGAQENEASLYYWL